MTRDYDGLDRLTREVSPQGQVDYEYDDAGRRTRLTVAGRTPVEYLYDDADRLTRIEQGAIGVDFTYDASNRRATITLPNGVAGTYSFDDADQLLSIMYQNGAALVGDVTYGYDLSGRRISQGGSLSKMHMPATVAGAVYDSANRLTSWGGNTLSYDNNGNLTADGTAMYGWNARDELLSTSDGAGTFAYDAVGRRTSRTVAGASTSYLHDGLNAAIVNNDQMISGLGLDANYARVSSDGVTSILSDGIGSTRSLLDESGASTAAYSYSPYGETARTGSDDSPPQFTGRENDGASGLYYYRARYYSPRFGRFIQSDPIGLAGGMNTYSYVLGNPVSFVDPLGLIDIEIPGATGETTVHANPGRDVIVDPNARAEHPPAHVHLGSNDGPRVRLTDFAPYSDDDAKKMTRKQKAFCANLTNKEKNMIRKRAKSVYKRGFFWVMVNGRVIKNVARAAGPFAALASYSENFSDVRACEYDPELEACPDE